MFNIHPCDPTVVFCYLIWPCDIAVCITYLISHSYYLTYNLRIFQFGCIINTKLPSCDDIIRRTSLGFPSWCSVALVLQTRTSRHQLGKPHDVQRIISTHSGGFVYISFYDFGLSYCKSIHWFCILFVRKNKFCRYGCTLHNIMLEKRYYF